MAKPYPANFRKELIDVIEEWEKTSHEKKISVSEMKYISGEYVLNISIKQRLDFKGITKLINHFGRDFEILSLQDEFHTYAQNSQYGSFKGDITRLNECLTFLDNSFDKDLDDLIKQLYLISKA